MNEPNHIEEVQSLAIEAETVLALAEHRLDNISDDDLADEVMATAATAIGMSRRMLFQIIDHSDALQQPGRDLVARLTAGRKRTAKTHTLVWNEHQGKQVAAIARYDPDGDLVFVSTPEGWARVTQAGGMQLEHIAGMLHRELLHEHTEPGGKEAP